MKKKLLMAVSYVLVLALAIGGTVAYFTDRDAEVNVFTVGNVDIELNETFEQGAELLPGKDVTKEATITNTGANKAWVWATVAIPAALDDTGNASKNIIHFNYSKESVEAGNWTWQDADGEWMISTMEKDGIEYNVYAVLHTTPLASGAETLPFMTKVYMDTRVDMTPEGDLYWVENGATQDLEWNVNADKQGAPLIYVAAYAIQIDTVESVYDGYEKYGTQWGENGVVNAGIVVNTAEELKVALKNNKDAKIILMQDIEIEKVDLTDNTAGDFLLYANGHTITIKESDAGIRSIHIKGENRSITIIDAKIVCNDNEATTNTDVRGVSFNSGSSGSKLNLIDCTIELTNGIYTYGINMLSSLSDMEINVEGCRIVASQPVKIFCSNSNFNFKNSTFISNNTHPFGLKEDYVTCIRLQDGSTGNEVNITGCTFDFIGTEAEKKTIYAVLDTGVNNTVNMESCVFGEGIEVSFKQV